MEWSHLSCQKTSCFSQKKVRESRPPLGSAPVATFGGRPGPGSERARLLFGPVLSCTYGSGEEGGEEAGEEGCEAGGEESMVSRGFVSRGFVSISPLPREI